MGCQDQEAVRTCSEQAMDGLQVLATVVIGEQHSCRCIQTACGKALQDRKEICLRDRSVPSDTAKLTVLSADVPHQVHQERQDDPTGSTA